MTHPPPSTTDCTDDLNRRQALQDLSRAELAAEGGDLSALSAWAQKWARPALEALQEAASRMAAIDDDEEDWT